MLEILRHDGSCSAQVCEGACEHALIADRDELGHAGAVAGGKEGDRVASARLVQIRMRFERCALGVARAGGSIFCIPYCAVICVIVAWLEARP
jgi:hypothetical protein